MADKLVQRCGKVAFMVINGTGRRMRGFTEMSGSKNAKEYSRQYVDEGGERTDVNGYAHSISFKLDSFKGDAVHAKIENIFENDLKGNAAAVNIVTVDFSKEEYPEGGYPAISRPYIVVPSSEGDSTDAYTLSGDFKAYGGKVKGIAVSEDNYMTCSFTEGRSLKGTFIADTATSIDEESGELRINTENAALIRFDISEIIAGEQAVSAEMTIKAAPRTYDSAGRRFPGTTLKSYYLTNASDWDGETVPEWPDWKGYAKTGGATKGISNYNTSDGTAAAPYQTITIDVSEAVKASSDGIVTLGFITSTARTMGIEHGTAVLKLHIAV